MGQGAGRHDTPLPRPHIAFPDFPIPMHSPSIRPVFKRRWIPVVLALAITLMCTLFAMTAKATASTEGCQPRASAKHSRFKRAVPKCTAQLARRATEGDNIASGTAGLRSGERVAAAASLGRGPGRNQ
jgi:hypothetical protein